MENKKIILTYIGEDDFGNEVYKDKSGKIFKNTEHKHDKMRLCTVYGGFYGEPDTPIEYIESYKDIIIEIKNNEDRNEKFKYRLLSRLQQDCDYYLGNGNRCKRHLWAEDEAEQIAKMKELYNWFDDDKKPEWLTYEDILNYEKNMINS